MEIKKTLVLDCGEPASKALPRLMDVPAVIVTRNGRYYGIIDHRSFAGQGIRDPSTVRCETLAVRPPVLGEESGVLERIGAFLLGHFKALPVVGEGEKPVGITTRVELLQDLLTQKLLPSESVPELMSSPVYSVASNDTVGEAKSAMKEKGTNKLVVTANGYPIGVVSDFDIGSWLTRPNMPTDRKSKEKAINVTEMRISEFLRPDIAMVEQNSTLQQAMERMVQKGASAVVVTSNRKPVGVLSALDIFRKLKEAAEAPEAIAISGLSGDNIGHYPHINGKVGHVVAKFSGTLSIRSVSVHVKEQKSTFVVSAHVEADGGPVIVKEERKSLRETVDEVASELDKALRKRKDMRRLKPRATRARKRRE